VRPSIEARAVDDIGGLGVDDEREYTRPVVRIIFEVGILYHEDIARKLGQDRYSPKAPLPLLLVKQDGKRNGGELVRTDSSEIEPAAGLQTQAAPASVALA
jgi:hypothetical protein